MNQPSKWQLRIHLLLVFLLFLIHHCHCPSSGLFVADAWSQGCPWQLHQVGSGAMAPMVQVMPLWLTGSISHSCLFDRFRGFVELTRKPIFPRTLFFTQQGQRSECWQKEALAYIYILYYIYSDIFASCLHLSWKLLLDLLASRNTSEIIWHDCSSFRIIPQMDSRD
jgi:hypothetical protein